MKEDFAKPARPPRIVGHLTSRVLITEREPLFEGGEPKTIGQLVDERLNAMTNPDFGERGPPAGWIAPAIHSVTVELEPEN